MPGRRWTVSSAYVPPVSFSLDPYSLQCLGHLTHPTDNDQKRNRCRAFGTAPRSDVQGKQQRAARACTHLAPAKSSFYRSHARSHATRPPRACSRCDRAALLRTQHRLSALCRALAIGLRPMSPRSCVWCLPRGSPVPRAPVPQAELINDLRARG